MPDPGSGDQRDITGSLSDRTFTIAILILVALGVAMRLDYLLGHYLWLDEVTSLNHVRSSWADFASWHEVPDPHPPLYYFFLRMSDVVSLGTAEETAIRLWTLVWFPVLAVSAWWYGTKKGSKVTMTSIVGLFAVAPLIVYVSAELRMYGMLGTIAALAVLAMANWLDQSRPSRVSVAGMGLVFLSLGLTHYSGVLIAVSLFCSGLAVRWARDSRFDWHLLVSAGVAAALFSPMLPILNEQTDFISRTLYSTALGEAAGLVAWAMSPVGVALVLIAVYGMLKGERRGDVHGDRLLAAIGIASALVFVGLIIVISLVRDIDILNLGVAIIPAVLFVFGVAAYAASVQPRLVFIVLWVAVAVTIPMTLHTNSDPTVFRFNRVATMDQLVGAEPFLSVPQDGEGLVVIHVDWRTGNDYFVRHGSNLYPAATFLPISHDQYPEIPALIEELSEEDDVREILIVNRIIRNPTVGRMMAAGSDWEHVGSRATLVRVGS